MNGIEIPNSSNIQTTVSPASIEQKLKVGLHNSSESNHVPFGQKKDLAMKNTLLLCCVYRIHINIPQQKWCLSMQMNGSSQVEPFTQQQECFLSNYWILVISDD